MDNNEATSTVMSRIQRLDPENACKIMGYILIQDPSEKEMIRLAFGPENHLISLINQAKSFLGISSNTSSAPSTPSPSPFNPMSNPHNRSNPFPISAPRIIVPNNGFHSSPSSPWFTNTSYLSPRPSSSSLSYAAVVNGNNSNIINGISSPSNSSFSQFYSNPSCENEDYSNIPVDDELLFLEDGKDLNFMDPIMSPSGRSDSILFPFADNGENRHHLLHKRSLSVSDAFLGGQLEDGHGGGGGWRPCMYYSKGFCKNGSGCKFVHGGVDSQEGLVGSPGLDGFEEFVRMKALQHQQQQQQRLALVGGGGGPHLYNSRCMNNFLNENPRSAAAALMMGEECHSFGRCRPDRNDFAALGYGGISNSSSRQIYLTFPADSTFKEEDVSNYFNTFGPVQDVRIPYQQKRMFGFVTFVYPETVKQILAKGNPHFVCESRVLVKPYKEKGKILDKKQHMDRGDFPACLSPSGLDSRDPCDLPFGGRMLYNSQEMLLRRKLEEQAELQQAIDFQGRRLMNFQLSDLSNIQPNHPFQPHLLAAGPRNSPTAHTQISQNLMLAPEDFNQDDFEGTDAGKREVISPNDAADPNAPLEMNKSCNHSNGDNDIYNDEGNIPNSEDSILHASLEHVLPDNLFASPTKSVADNQALLCVGSAESDNCSSTTVESSSNTISVLATTSMLSVASLKS